MGCSSRILILYPQCYLLKCKRKPFHVWEDPRNPGKGNRFVDRGKLT